MVRHRPAYQLPQRHPDEERGQGELHLGCGGGKVGGNLRERRRAILRTEAGRNPHDKTLHDLVGELSTRSDDFRRRRGSHDVRLHGAGSKSFNHPVVGNLELAYESVDMISEPGLTLTIYAAEPASPTADALALLASWASTATEPSAESPTSADRTGT